MSRKRININLTQIARECNVSIATISRVVNNKTNVNERTRERVLKVLQKHNITITKAPLVSELKHIAILFHSQDIFGIHHHGYDMVIKKIETSFTKEGYSIIMVRLNEENTLPEIVQNSGTKGVILLGHHISEMLYITLETQSIPFVCIDMKSISSRYFSVNTDNVNGIEKAVDHLVELGHKKISFISGNIHDLRFKERFNSFKQEIEDHNLPVIRKYIKIIGDNEEKEDFIIRAMEEIFKEDSLPSAIILSSNIFAESVIHFLSKHNMRIPEDVSIIGFDDGVATQSSAKISLIQPDWENKGQLAASILFSQIKGITIHPYRAIVTNRLINNNTCLKYNKNGIRRNQITPIVLWTAPGKLYEHEKNIITQWNKNNPKSIVTFNPVPRGMETEEVIKSSIIQGASPDLYQGIEAFFANYLARDGVLVPLDTMEGFSTIVKERKIEKFLDKIRADDGHIYILPQHWTPIYGIYNRKLLKMAGFDTPPKTYSEFNRFAEHVKNIGNTIPTDFPLSPNWWITARYWHAFNMATSGEKGLYFDIFKIDRPESRAIFRFLSNAVKNGYISNDRHTYDFFTKGNVGYKLIRNPETLLTVNQMDSELSLVFSPPPIPDYIESPCNPWLEASIKGASIFKDSNNIERSWNFIKWYYLTEENDLNLLRSIAHIPCRGDLRENQLFADFFTQYPYMKKFIDFMDKSGTIIHPDKIEIFRIIAEKLWKPLILENKNNIDELFEETITDLSDLQITDNF